jgi:hypothetical protein
MFSNMVMLNSKTKMGNETTVGTNISGTEVVRIRTGFNFMLLCPCNVDSHNTQRPFTFCWLNVEKWFKLVQVYLQMELLVFATLHIRDGNSAVSPRRFTVSYFV